MKRPVFVNDQFYHIFNRGADKRDIFTDEQDYRRFLFSMKGFNDINSTLNFYRRLNVRSRTSLKPIKQEPLVKILCYCLMPNHFHLVARQLEENGITSFMRKIGTGYTNYFNQKYKRSGVLFQGKFKSILIEGDEYLNYLIQYIDLNPLELIEPNWKGEGLKNWDKSKEFLKSYQWTNCNDYEKYSEIFENYDAENLKKIEKLIIE